MNQIMENWNRFLNESSLSRLYRHILDYDTAILTGYRDSVTDMSKCTRNSVEPGISNKIRNRNIKATLLSKKYGVTHVDGSYIENFNTPEAMEVSENSLFVVNLTNDPNFHKDIFKLGEKFCQDSILIIPKGGKGAYLIGTNTSEFPGYGNKVSVGDVSFGDESEFMTKVNNRPLTFKEDDDIMLETYDKLSRQEKMAVSYISKKFLK